MSFMGMYDRPGDQYPEFQTSLKQRFGLVVGNGRPLFTTDADELFDLFLINLPEDSRQHYTCSACRHFVNHYGGLVVISAQGEAEPVLWEPGVVPEFFRYSVAAIQQRIRKAKVTGVFLSGQAVLGQPLTGDWEHLSVSLPRRAVHDSRVKTAGQVMADKREDHRILNAALQEYSDAIVGQAVALLKTDTLYRSDKVLGVAEWFHTLKGTLANTKDSKKRANIKWLAVATAPAGWCHVKSSMIGTLLDDLKDGMAIDAVGRRFAEKMRPSNYMRAQTAPTQTNIEQAEKIVERLGIADSLRRRYARFDEIPHFLWRDQGGDDKAVVTKPEGVFSGLKAKGVTEPGQSALPGTVMTWEKFQRTILPTAKMIEAKADDPSRFMAMVTAASPDSPNILQWDNPFSWYYHSGIDAEIRRRVEAAGGQHQNNEIRCSLIWEGYTDLDLHCTTPLNQHIFYGNKRDSYSGWLDVDANGGRPTTPTPVENIRWPQGRALVGPYRFYVHNYQERGKGTTPFKVELEIGGKVYAFHGVAGDTGWSTDVFVFEYTKDKHPNIRSHGISASDDSWGVSVGNFVRVCGITESPNQWCETKVAHSGHHLFFLLDGCRDSSEGKGRGFFTEMLKSDLREVRKTLEAYTASTPIEDANTATACGVGFSKDNAWNLTLKVTANGSTRLITIDRWD